MRTGQEGRGAKDVFSYRKALRRVHGQNGMLLRTKRGSKKLPLPNRGSSNNCTIEIRKYRYRYDDETCKIITRVLV